MKESRIRIRQEQEPWIVFDRIRNALTDIMIKSGNGNNQLRDAIFNLVRNAQEDMSAQWRKVIEENCGPEDKDLKHALLAKLESFEGKEQVA